MTDPIDLNAYRELESDFQKQVAEDSETIKAEIKAEVDAVYFPIAIPEEPVDYVFVAMEPSLRGNTPTKLRERIERGERLFDTSTPRLPLFMQGIKRFLCGDGQTFLVTDIAKGAMLARVANIKRDERYLEWYPLLLREIEILAKSTSPVIAVGNKSESFLKAQGMDREVYKVPHYSRVAVRHWQKKAEAHGEWYETFKQNNFGPGITWDTNITESQKQLLFSYYLAIEDIRASINAGE